jgi:hypothetical protein
VKTIPVHEPEVIAAGAARLRGDDEKMPTTAVNPITRRGVVLISRYSKADELETMAKMVEAMPPAMVRDVLSVFCDSKIGHCYRVKMRWGDLRAAVEIGDQVERASGGHNGISVESKSTPWSPLVLDPYWPGDGPDNPD